MLRTYSRSPVYFFRRLVLTCLFVVFAFLLGLIPRVVIPVISLPLTLQNAAVFLAGSLLGSLGVFSMLLFFMLVALGLPLLSGGRGGLEVFLSPSVGFFIGSVLATLVIGILVERRWHTISFFGFFFVNICGLVVLYACGIISMVFIVSMSFEKALKSVMLFIPMEILLITCVSFVAVLFKRHYPLVISHKKRINPRIEKTSIRARSDTTNGEAHFRHT